MTGRRRLPRSSVPSESFPTHTPSRRLKMLPSPCPRRFPTSHLLDRSLFRLTLTPGSGPPPLHDLAEGIRPVVRAVALPPRPRPPWDKPRLADRAAARVD